MLSTSICWLIFPEIRLLYWFRTLSSAGTVPCDILTDDLFVRVKREEVIMEHFNVVAGLIRNFVFSIGSHCLHRFSVRQDVNVLACVARTLVAFVKREAGNQCTGQNHYNAEDLDMPEGGVYI
jgi:hypothetical protein